MEGTNKSGAYSLHLPLKPHASHPRLHLQCEVFVGTKAGFSISVFLMEVTDLDNRTLEKDTVPSGELMF